MLNECELSLTDAALNHLQNYLKKNSLIALRIRVEEVGCSGLQYVIDEIKNNAELKNTDIQKQFGPDVTIYIDNASIKALNGLCIDFGKAPGEENNPLKPARLLFINPNEKGSCGCGESFTI